MIKTWHKWFVCIFATVFVSVFFMYDAIFINGSTSDIIVTPPVIADDENKDYNTSTTPTEPDIKDDEKKDETIPTYTNGFACLYDSLQRFNSCKNYNMVFSSSANSFGVIQNIKGSRILNDNSLYLETFAFCESSLGQTWYERITTNDNQNVEYIKTKNVDKNFNYNLNGAKPKIYTREEFTNTFGKKLEAFSLIPQKGIDKLTKFDRATNKKYYVATFTINISKLPKSQIEIMLKESGANSIRYKSISITYYISKTTGNIEKVEQSEIYNMDLGINVSINYKFVGQIKY